MAYKTKHSPEKWRDILTPEQYRVLREKGTEAPYSGALYKNSRTGLYHCAACGAELFSSRDKYESGSGWPSFHSPHNESALETRKDSSHGMQRIEVLCANCGSHLGHVFPDGPPPTGRRYCINSVSLDFKEGKQE